jgi:CubicO group peptidase (beta-lactamase class C family)
LIGPNHIPEHTNPREDATQQQVEAPAGDTEQTHIYKLAQLNPVISPFKHASSKAWRQAQIPASNGHSDARSLAKLYSALANGGKIEHHQLLDPAVLLNATTSVVENQTDLIMNQVIKRSRGGFILSHNGNYGPSMGAFGHAGAGGSMAFGDPVAKVGFAYVMNQLQPEGYEPRYRDIANYIYHKIG